MRRREFLKYSAATAVAAPFVRPASADTGVYKVGVVGAKTGPLAPGATVTHFPPFRLWASEVNARGGLKLKDGMRKIEIVEYDDRTQPPEAIKAVERAAAVDKCDWIAGVYATGFNLATAPTFDKYKYPQIAVACITDQTPALAKKYPHSLSKLCEGRDRRAQKAEGRRPDRQQGRRRQCGRRLWYRACQCGTAAVQGGRL
jgi:branched-chain amino acid transport system substrate-binding protein